MKKIKGFKKRKIEILQRLNANQASLIDELEDKTESEYLRGVNDGIKAFNTQKSDMKDFIHLEGIKRNDAFTIPFNDDYIKVTLHKGYLRWKYEKPKESADPKQKADH